MYVCKKCGQEFEHIYLPNRTDAEEKRLWIHKEFCGGIVVEQRLPSALDSDFFGDPAEMSSISRRWSELLSQSSLATS